MSNPSPISVIIPHFTGGGRAANLRAAIDSVLTQTVARQIELIVVCNPPSHESVELQSLYGSKVKVLSSPEANANAARNLGLRSARGRYSVFLDDDCVFGDKNSLERILTPMEKDPALIACGGDYKLSDHASHWDRAYSRIQQEWIRRSQLPDKTSENLFGGFLAVKLAELNGIDFEESIPFGGAELSFVRKLRDTGKKIRWFEDVKVNHAAGLTLRQFLNRGFKQGFTSGRFPQLAVSKVLHGRETSPVYFTDALFRLYFEWGRIAGSAESRRTFLYARAIRSFVREVFSSNRRWRQWQEVRTLAEVYRRKII